MLKEFKPELSRKTSFFTTSTVEVVCNELIATFEESGTPYVLSDKAWKLNISYLEESKEDNVSEQVNYQVELLDAGLETICVEFKRIGGSSMAFHNQFNTVMQRLSSSYIQTACL